MFLRRNSMIRRMMTMMGVLLTPPNIYIVSLGVSEEAKPSKV